MLDQMTQLQMFKSFHIQNYLFMQPSEFFWNLPRAQCSYPEANSSTPGLVPFTSCSFLNIDPLVMIFFPCLFKTIFSFSDASFLSVYEDVYYA